MEKIFKSLQDERNLKIQLKNQDFLQLKHEEFTMRNKLLEEKTKLDLVSSEYQDLSKLLHSIESDIIELSEYPDIPSELEKIQTEVEDKETVLKKQTEQLNVLKTDILAKNQEYAATLQQ